MKKRKYAALLLALTILLALPGWQRERHRPGRSVRRSGPTAPTSRRSCPTPARLTPPTPARPAACPPTSRGETLEVDGKTVPALLYESDLGYTMLYPQEGVTLSEWEGGQTFELTDAPGTYLAVSLLDVSNVDEAVAVVQFENAVDGNPSGYIFGAKRYAGVRLSDAAGGLTVDYIILREGGSVYLVERAVFTGGEGRTACFRACWTALPSPKGAFPWIMTSC